MYRSLLLALSFLAGGATVESARPYGFGTSKGEFVGFELFAGNPSEAPGWQLEKLPGGDLQIFHGNGYLAFEIEGKTPRVFLLPEGGNDPRTRWKAASKGKFPEIKYTLQPSAGKFQNWYLQASSTSVERTD